MPGEETVRIAQGQLRGHWLTAAWGNLYLAFHGIPYAAPPVGHLRFKPPQPAPAWSGVRDATREGSVAPHVNMFTGEYQGDEDCLFLNVYTPRLPSESSSRLLPVIVMVHGGGLAVMSGNMDVFGPDFILQHEIIMVSFNYRLGVLGFLSTGDSVVPGNMGFKDQVQALRWVRDNIASFGGDAGNVTIIGTSAGGWSCHALVLSPLAKGLFRRAIAQSGVAVGDGVVTTRMRERSFALAAHLGLRTTDSKELVDFLARQPARALVENAAHGCSDEDKARGVMFPFVGTVEPADGQGGAFLDRDPADILRSGDFQPVPLITGVCAFEGSLFVLAHQLQPELVSNVATNHQLLIPTNLRCTNDDKAAVAEQIRSFYFGHRDICADTTVELLTLLGDLMFNYPAVRVATSHSSKSSAPVYFYISDLARKMVAEGSFPEETEKILQEAGELAGHGSDLGHVYQCCLFEGTPEPDSEDGKAITKVTRMWTNFAETGQPTPEADPALGVSWPAFMGDAGRYLRMGQARFSVAQRPFAERAAFWDGIYRRYDG